MNTSLQTMIAGSCMFATLVLSRPGLAAPSTVAPSPRTVRLEIDVEGLGDTGIGLDQIVRRQLGPQLTQADFELVDQDNVEAAVTLQVRLRALESGEYDYGVHFDFIDGGRHIPAIEWVDCHMCVDARLIPMLDARAPELLMALEHRITEAAPAPAPTSAPLAASENPGPVDTPGLAEPEPQSHVITRRGIGGLVLAGLGVGGLIWSGVELSRGVVTMDNGNERIRYVDHRPAGYALIVGGTTALVGGAVLVFSDLSRQARRRNQLHASQPRVYPLLSPTGAGLGVIGRF